MIEKDLELWADSFHEGDWACNLIGKALISQGGTHNVFYEGGFLPIHTYSKENWVLRLTVYGSYKSWKPLPTQINDLLSWGKPDFLVYDKGIQKILFAAEETAAVPTGNQALQRCERMYGSVRSKIPFWYLISEFGIHKDGGVRRDSIWPTVMALKASKGLNTPCVVLHYSDVDNPENYLSGFGLQSLFDILLDMLINDVLSRNIMHGVSTKLVKQYSHMVDFVESQWNRMLDYLPGHNCFEYRTLSEEYSRYAVNEKPINYLHSTDSFLVWPLTNELPRDIKLKQKAKKLIKHDNLCALLERDVGAGKAYCLSSNAGSRPQERLKVEGWIASQRKLFKKGQHLAPDAIFDLQIEDFPPSQNGYLHLTTSPNIVYLYDRWEDLSDSIKKAYPRLEGKLSFLERREPVFFYISNSLKPGRIFGDPFTGQISAYSLSFGRFDNLRRRVIAYFPHQAHTQACFEMRLKGNKGLTLMRELTDLLIFTGGVGINLNSGEIL